MNFFTRFFKTAPPPVEPSPQPKSIYDLGRAVSDRFDEVAHPGELRAHGPFQKAARDLAALHYSNDELLTYALGENATTASLALSALAARDARATAADILEHLNSFEGRWTKFFALEALDRLTPAPEALIGRVIVAMNDDWSDGYDRFLTQFARELASRRAAAGEPLTFGDALGRATGDRLDDVDALLKKLESAVAAPLQAELAAHRAQHANLGYLRTIGMVWANENDTEIVAHEVLDAAAEFIEQSLTGERRRSVLVSGDEGTGKSTVIRAAAQRLHAAGWTIFEAGATEIVAGQSYIGQLEARLQKIVKNLRGARRVAWIIPNLHELQFAGAYKQNPTSVLDMLLPEIESGAIAVIGEVSAQAYTRLIEQKRAVRSAFVSIRIEPMADEAALQLAREWARRRDVRLTEDVLSEAWQLTTQFLGTRAAPGNILGLLELAVNEHAVITVDDILIALARQTGLPVSILDEREGLDPQALREHFAERVLGQPEAVDVLVERVSMIKAGLTDPTRPLGVFLFAGPTGTGKTEIAKALATYLFGSAERMIRVDMSELQTAESLSRLVGESEGTVTSLADEIRRQPFSVVLLDEMEKAHRNVLDLFLQVFDDGRLTDRRGNIADFRHTIVILTSNLGSAIPTSGRAGFSDGSNGFTPSSVMKAIERELRKELVNRFDRVIVFRPLTRETMRGILRKELQDALRRRGLRNRDWVVEWDDSALEFLLDQGFTADLGARPLKRAVERHFLTPLAERIVTRRAPAGDQSLLLRAEEGQLVIKTK